MEAKYPSKIRVERDGYLVYAEGDDIPETDTAELSAQGYIDGVPATEEAPKRRRAPRNKVASAGENKGA